jgi:hypothetical protein
MGTLKEAGRVYAKGSWTRRLGIIATYEVIFAAARKTCRRAPAQKPLQSADINLRKNKITSNLNPNQMTLKQKTISLDKSMYERSRR